MDLYFAPMACSLASRIAAYESGADMRFHRVQLATKTVEGGADYLNMSPKGQVPMLRLKGGGSLTETPAILQFIADQRPDLGLAPPPGALERYELQMWLNYVGTELHKQILWTTFAPDTPAEAKAYVRTLIPVRLAFVESHLTGRAYLLGDRFTVADAYLLWVFLLLQRLGVDFGDWPNTGAYVARCMERDAVSRAVGDEAALFGA